MIHYYTNREISGKLEINLARWKRWSRSFLPPDPLGGMQSGYARQYIFKDVIKVYLGGHLLSHWKMGVPESLQVINDLSPWFKRTGYFEINGSAPKSASAEFQSRAHRIYFSPARGPGMRNGPAFRYFICRTIQRQSEASQYGRCVVETYEESLINWESPDGSILLQDPEVRMINPSAMVATVVAKLHRTSR